MSRSVLHIVDADWTRRAHLARLALAAGHHAETYSSAEELVAHSPRDGLVLTHDGTPATDATGVIEAITRSGQWLPVIAMADELDSVAIVRAMKAGALDYLPVPQQVAPLNDAIARSAPEVDVRRARQCRAAEARKKIDQLTAREREVLDLLAEGASNKDMARVMGISVRTVEIHRLRMLSKLGSINSVDAARLKFEATELGRLC